MIILLTIKLIMLLVPLEEDPVDLRVEAGTLYYIILHYVMLNYITQLI